TANATGAFVSTITKPAPLTIYPEARDKTYPDFINDLNMAMTTYELGLSGTADSKLFLGDLGTITVTGIKLNVKTTLDGLRGLADVKFKNIIQMFATSEKLGADTLVDINNPSKLTLTIGDLALKTGANFSSNGFAGYSYLKNLVLKPGSNIVVSSTIFDQSLEVGPWILRQLSTQNPPDLYLYPFIGSHKNKALDAGLQNLRQIVDIPPFAAGSNSTPKPYAQDWYLRAPDSAAVDGIVYIKTKVANPFYSANMNVLSFRADSIDPFAPIPSFNMRSEPGSAFVPAFQFVLPGGFALKGFETAEKEFAVQCDFSDPVIAADPVPYWLSLPNVETNIDMSALVEVGDLGQSSQYWASAYVYGTIDETGYHDGPPMRLHFASDAVNLSKYWNKIRNPVAPPPAVNTTIPVAPSMTVSPSPTSVPVTPTTEPVPPTTEPVPPTTQPVPSPTTTVDSVPTIVPSPPPVAPSP
ncbi:hypothetical protein BGZ82_003038, partial [Podila clonocystis]